MKKTFFVFYTPLLFKRIVVSLIIYDRNQLAMFQIDMTFDEHKVDLNSFYRLFENAMKRPSFC